MRGILTAVLSPLVTLHGSERRVAVLMFAYSFLAMSAWNIVRPLTRSRFISDLGADNIPWVMLGAGVFIGLLMNQYTHLIARLPRRRVIPVTQAGIAVILVVFWVLLRTGAVWVTVAFYLLGLVLGLLLISQFWTLANDIYDARQAKRIFGFIGGGASLGGAFGAGVTRLAVSRTGDENMILVGAATLGLCALVVNAILARHAMSATAEVGHEEEGVGALEALRMIRASRHLRIMALVIGFAAAGAQIIDQQLNMAAEASRGAQGAEAIAEFLAEITIYLSLAGFVVQVALTRWIHHSFGLAVALLLLPIALGSTAVVILLTGAVWATGVARVLDATVRYTIDKTTREVLFLPLPAEVKYRAKPFIDVTADRFAKATAALMLLILIKPWGLGLDWRRLSYASLVMVCVWIVAVLVARREYLRAFRRSIGLRALAGEAIRTDVGDAATIEALVEELSNPDPSAVLYAIGMLETLGKRHLISPLLLQHEEAAVRARALEALSAVRPRIAARWRKRVERLMHDRDVDVRAAALRALAHVSRQDIRSVLRQHLHDAAPRVVVTACVGLARSDDPADVEAAEAALQSLIADRSESAAAGRREAAVALAHIPLPRFRPLLVPLIYDSDVAVVERAIRSARALGAEDGLFLPGLVSLLGHSLLKTNARDALIGYGPAAVGALAHVLSDPREDIWVRRHIPATLSAIPVPESVAALVGALDDSDGFLRFKAVVALERARRDHPELSVPAAAAERLILSEASRYYKYLALRHDIEGSGTNSPLLARALGEKLDRIRDRVYRLLALVHPADDIAAARYTIERGGSRGRASAIEYLDNLLGGAIRKRVLPMLDETPGPEKLRHAYLVLKSRPRELEDALVQLVHDEDPVVAATAVQFAARGGHQGLRSDLQYLLARRHPAGDPAAEAAAWVLREWSGERSSASLPLVELAERLQGAPPFDSVSVDELFRTVTAGTEVHYAAGRDLFTRGAMVPGLILVVDGVITLIDGDAVHPLQGPVVLGLEEVLGRTPATVTARAVTTAVCLRVDAGEFLAALSNNLHLAEALLRLLLPGTGGVATASLDIRNGPDDAPLQPFDQALALRDHPLLDHATPSDTVALIRAGREVALRSGDVLIEAGAPASILQVLEGAILVDTPGHPPRSAAAGTTLLVVETLGGVPAPCRATVTAAGRALRIDRDSLFGVLTDRPHLLRGLFARVLRLRQRSRAGAARKDGPTGNTVVACSYTGATDVAS